MHSRWYSAPFPGDGEETKGSSARQRTPAAEAHLLCQILSDKRASVSPISGCKWGCLRLCHTFLICYFREWRNPANSRSTGDQMAAEGSKLNVEPHKDGQKATTKARIVVDNWDHQDTVLNLQLPFTSQSISSWRLDNVLTPKRTIKVVKTPKLSKKAANDIWGDSSYWCKKKKEGGGRNCLFVRRLLLYHAHWRFLVFLLLQTSQGWPVSLAQGLSEFDCLISLEQKQDLVLRAQKQGRGGANLSLASCLTGTT